MEAKVSQPTVAELIALLEKQQAEIDELKRRQAEYRPIGSKVTPTDDSSKIRRADHPEPGGGYIIQSPRSWTGERMGLAFRNGIAIIDEAHPQCDELAHWMEADYHYTVQAATAEEINRMRRLLEGVPVESKPKTAGEKLMSPAFSGKVTR